MIQQPIPDLTQEQWDVLAQQLKKGASPEVQAHLKEAKEIASKIRVVK